MGACGLARVDETSLPTRCVRGAEDFMRKGIAARRRETKSREAGRQQRQGRVLRLFGAIALLGGFAACLSGDASSTDPASSEAASWKTRVASVAGIVSAVAAESTIVPWSDSMAGSGLQAMAPWAATSHAHAVAANR